MYEFTCLFFAEDVNRVRWLSLLTLVWTYVGRFPLESNRETTIQNVFTQSIQANAGAHTAATVAYFHVW
jgi:hypothetical protein